MPEQELKPFLEAEAMKEFCLLAHSRPCLASFLIKTRTTCLGIVAAHSGRGTAASVKNKDPPPKTCPEASLIWAIVQLRQPFLETGGCVKLITEGN